MENSWSPELPIAEYRTTITSLVSKFPVTVFLSETGSGKSTQIPRFLLEASLSPQPYAITCTQPRRVACTTLTNRVKEECSAASIPTSENVIGYKVRFDDRTWSGTRIIYQTDGMLLREASCPSDPDSTDVNSRSGGDPLLRKYGVIVLDEVHERSLNTELLFGVVKRAMSERSKKNSKLPPLKVVIMSATISDEMMREITTFFGDEVGVVRVPGRTYPVQVLYLPDGGGEEEEEEDEDYTNNYTDRVVEAVESILTDGYEKASHRSGDILVFLPGSGEIMSVYEILTSRVIPNLLDAFGSTMENVVEILDKNLKKRKVQDSRYLPPEVLPLHASLPPAALSQPFTTRDSSTYSRRIILSTNVAETSVTIPGVRWVIDSGVRRVRVCATTSAMGSKLLTIPTTSSNCEQRKGRAGRTQSGVCLRLFSERYGQRASEVTIIN